MNVVYIHTHDSGRYIGPYGYQNMTPNINEFGRDALVFRQCYCAGPTCSPSRAALLTGMWPHCNGMLGLAHRGFSLYDYEQHVTSVFNANGFETVLSGIQHEASEASKLGYQFIYNQAEGTDMYISDPETYDHKSVREIQKYLAGRNREKPFFISLGLISCHRDFPKNKVADAYVAPPPQIYDCPENRKDMAGYLTSASIADDCVGQMISVLKEDGLYDDTIILYTTDHGIAFPWMNCNLYDTGIGVACILRQPGSKMNGKVSDALISHIDVFPTIFELCGIKVPEWMQGKSLVPILKGEQEEINEEIFAEVTYHAAYEPMRCIRTARYKLIQRFDSYDEIVPANIDNGESKRFLLKAGLLSLKKKRPKEYLFDLYLDPMERENLIDEAEYQEIRNTLSCKLQKWMEKTKDPLTNDINRVKVPQGAIINKQSCIDAEIADYE